MARTHIDIELRWGDQDAYGHVNNVAYGRFLEEARVRTFSLGSGREDTGLQSHFRESYGDAAAGEPAGRPLKTLVAAQSIEYVRVLEYSAHPLEVQMWIGKLGGSSMELHYELFDGAAETPTVVARAITHVVVVDGETLRPTRLSPEGRRAIEPWTDAPVKLRRV